MRIVRAISGLLTGLLVAFVAAAAAQAATLSESGASEKVCQLTGQTDWYSERPPTRKP